VGIPCSHYRYLGVSSNGKDTIGYLAIIHRFRDRRDPKSISRSYLSHGGLDVITANAPLGELLPKVDDEKVGEKSSPNWVREILPVPVI
jgi:hypothetical protein